MTCGSCKQWHSFQDPMALGEKKGECRESPPQIAMAVSPQGQMVNIVAYPVTVEAFAACARFVEKE